MSAENPRIGPEMRLPSLLSVAEYAQSLGVPIKTSLDEGHFEIYRRNQEKIDRALFPDRSFYNPSEKDLYEATRIIITGLPFCESSGISTRSVNNIYTGSFHCVHTIEPAYFGGKGLAQPLILYESAGDEIELHGLRLLFAIPNKYGGFDYSTDLDFNMKTTPEEYKAIIDTSIKNSLITVFNALGKSSTPAQARYLFSMMQEESNR